MTPHRPPIKALKRTIARIHERQAREAQAAVIRESSKWQEAFDAVFKIVGDYHIVADDYDRLNADLWLMNGGE
jgi:hypothetical protein